MQIAGGLGGLLFLVGWIWLIIIAFQKDGALWGILNIFFQPIMGIIYFLVNKSGGLQVALMIIGALISGASFGSAILGALG